MDDNARIRQLAMTAAGLIQVFGEMWEAYEGLFAELDMTDPEVIDRTSGAILELEDNLTDILDRIRGQLFVMSGVYEPVPKDTEVDLEASVLSDIADLGEIDLEQYRVPDIKFDITNNHIESEHVGWDDDLDGLTKEQLVDRIIEMRSIIDEISEDF